MVTDEGGDKTKDTNKNSPPPPPSKNAEEAAKAVGTADGKGSEQGGGGEGIWDGEEEVEEENADGWDKGDKGKMEKVVVEEVDMVQVDLVIRDGSYSTVRDMHTYMQGLYRKSSGRLQLWTVCNSPECGMLMLSGLKDATMGGARGADLLPGAVGLNKSAGRQDGDGDVSPYGLVTDRSGVGAGSTYRMSGAGVGGRGGGGRGSSRERCIFLMNLLVDKRGPAMEPHLDDAAASDASDEDSGELGLDRAGAGEGLPAHHITLTGNVTSNNCGVSLHVNASAMNFEVYYTKAMHYTLMVTASSFAQVLLLVRQIDYSNSRSSAVKVSLLTIGQQAVMDSYLCLMQLFLTSLTA